LPMRRPPHHHNGPHHHHRGPHAGWGEHDQLRGRNQLYWEDSITTAHNPYEDVVDSPGLVHAWEKHHVLSWLNTVGLGDVIASFKSQKIKGEDLIKLTPKNAADHLKLKDQTTVMRVLERVMPLKEEWKAARQAAGLKTGPSLFASYVPEPERPKRLIAELHVLIHGLTALPPGAAGSYVCLELGDHVAKSSFVPRPRTSKCTMRIGTAPCTRVEGPIGQAAPPPSFIGRRRVAIACGRRRRLGRMVHGLRRLS